MSRGKDLDAISISGRSHRLVNQILEENPALAKIMRTAKRESEVRARVRERAERVLSQTKAGRECLATGREEPVQPDTLRWRDLAAVRLIDYVEYAGKEFQDLNLQGRPAQNNPIKQLWLAATRGRGGANSHFFEDMLHLFRQFNGRERHNLPSRETVEAWMTRHPSGLHPAIIELREKNRERILNVIIERIERDKIRNSRYTFESGLSPAQKMERALEWWQTRHFHLRFAIRSPETLNEMLGDSLARETMRVLRDAESAGIPFFINPYYLSLLNVDAPEFARNADLAIRDYMLYSRQLVDQFGSIVAWEKEDLVEPGKPNAAGWLLPWGGNVHRRYPEVAILIPDTTGRACGGLCSSCQRMYDFQSRHLNFDLNRLRPKKSWPDKLRVVMDYFENDSQLRDILITGGDALMSSDKSLGKILDAVYEMASRKREANLKRPDGQKYSEILRVRLGTRLPAYLPQRITSDLANVLRRFKEKASAVGIEQFVIQTHFESPMEVTPEARDAVRRLLNAGWIVTNQLVVTTAASRRGHTAKLRQTLNEIGVLPYYSFAVKGFKENSASYSTMARVAHERTEEKRIGAIPKRYHKRLRELTLHADKLVENIAALRQDADLPFLATDRSVLNLPGVGKSLTFRVIGITRYGRRILAFDHDPTRQHSPIIEQMGKVIIVESKSVAAYLEQLEELGEDLSEYDGIFGYSTGLTEPRMAGYEYPSYEFEVTDQLTNLDLDRVDESPKEAAS